MPAGSAQFLSLERLPAEGTLLVPGRLGYGDLLALEKKLAGRPITWLVEENALVEPEVRDHLSKADVLAAAFSEDDPSPADVGEALQPKLENGGLLIFIPGDTIARPGAPCHISAKQLHFLCALGLPTTPLAVHIPAECALSIEPVSKLPPVIFAVGHPIPAGQTTPARYRESLLEASERAFSSREFLDGSLAEALLAGLKKWGGSTSLHDGSDDSSLAFSKLMGAAIALSREIKEATNNPRVGIILPPGKAGLLANLAVLFAGKIPVNLNFTASQDAVNSAIRQADLDRFITADPFVRKVTSFPWPPNRDLIFIERVLPVIKNKIIKWVILGKLLPLGLLSKLLGLGKRRGDDEAILLFTSGSSGEPKGVPLSHRNVLANVCQFGAPLALPNKTARILGCLPLFHSFGCTVTLWYPVIEGIDLVTYPSPMETKRLAELIEKHKVHLLLSTPTFLRGYMRRIDPEQLASLQLVVTGAEKLPASLADAFEKKFGQRPLEGYGLTETSPATNVNLPPPPVADGDETPVLPQQKQGSVGHFLPGIAVRITNAATDEPTTLDQSGVIWMKGSNIFQGYLDRPDLTEPVMEDGWFKSGDVGRMDDEGFLYIEGRISRFSKIAGEMVPHETVEDTITKVLALDSESERKIAVVGVPDEKKGEAIVLLSAIASETLQQETVDLRYKLMDTGMPSLWCPREIIPVEEIPVLASGKLDIKACERLAPGAVVAIMPGWIAPHLEKAGGQLRFDRFMELALYDARHGYYTSRITDVGRSADFSTSATLSQGLGRAIAAWIRSHPARSIIEIGAGNGELAATVQQALPFLTRRRCQWHIVERSPRLRLLQEKHLGARIRWHETLPAALSATGGEALIYSNEVPDAFPVRVFRAEREAGAFEELHLAAGTEQDLLETWRPAPDLPQSTLFDRPWAPGQQLEVHESVHRWMEDWIPHWKAGALLTIDYGGSPQDIYHRRPKGTLRGYLLHQMITGPELLSNPGRQDLTADVNFDDLESWGRELGLQTTRRISQASFLAPHLDRASPSDEFLLAPDGAGTAFQVLEQAQA